MRYNWLVTWIDSQGDKIEAVPDVYVEGPRTQEDITDPVGKWLEDNYPWLLEIPFTAQIDVRLDKTGRLYFHREDEGVYEVESPSDGKRAYLTRVGER